MKKQVRFILLFIIFLLPLLSATPELGYEEVKVLFFILAVFLAGLLSKNKFKLSRIGIASALFLFILLITALTGIDPLKSIIGKEPYFQGLVLYSFLFLFFILISSSGINLKTLATVYTASATMVSIAAIREWVMVNILKYQIPTYGDRVVSTFGQPNFYAGFLLLTLPFSYYLFKNQSKKLNYFGMISGLVSLIGILVSYSRSAIILALILLIFGLIDQLRSKFKIILTVLAIFCISTFVALKYASGLVGNEVSRPILTGNPNLTKESVEKRVYIWPLAVQLFLQKPLTGYGLENISQAFFNYFTSNKHPIFEENLSISPVLISLKELNIDRSHNYILDLLLFSGSLGFFTWIYLVALLFWKAKHSKILLVSLITYLIWTAFQNQSVVQLIYFWLLVGLIDQEDKMGA